MLFFIYSTCNECIEFGVVRRLLFIDNFCRGEARIFILEYWDMVLDSPRCYLFFEALGPDFQKILGKT